MKVNVHSIHFDANRELVDFIQKRVDKLVNYHDGIIGGDVFLRIDKSDANKNKIVEIKLSIPGKELFAKKQCKSFEEATDLAIEALRRQVTKRKGKLKTV